ncbi:putative uncharacterized protein [Clostridium sp. CAG:440]|jgi:hypothetical protein|nr:putative uncharacterized protein [Clostridium sp. CAG:440]HJJ15209.1 Rpn family recombination-promoting nuclease/putative transposase [Clostridiaceae bacterium]
MNRKFVSKSNLVLSKILNSNNCLDILKDFIETILKVKIKNITLNNPKENKYYSSTTYYSMGIVEVRIQTEDEELNVGIQIIDGNYVQNKMFLYYARVHTNQITYNDNRKIAKTVTINILDFNYFSSYNYHRKISIKTNIIDDNILETMEMHVIELPKFKMLNLSNIKKEEAWIGYFQGQNLKLIQLSKEKFSKISKLDELLEKYWKEEKIE